MTAARYVCVLLVVTLFGLLAVAQRTRVIHLGYELEVLRSDRLALSDQNRVLLCDVSALSRPERIADEIRRSNIGLMDPVTLTRSIECESRNSADLRDAEPR